jgi:L-seryl-tRNA(Ser) seleniumtransferase
MSGDKLLGGVQAGIIVGRRKFLDIVRANPMRRALRIDKVTIAALQALLRTYLFDKHPEKIVPILSQSTGDLKEYKKRADKIAAGLSAASKDNFEINIVDDLATIGGGSFACQDVPSVAVCIRCGSEQDAVALAKMLRTKQIPILSRIKGVEVRINLRSVRPYEDDDLGAGLDASLSNPSNR